jgi:hypothetical protein
MWESFMSKSKNSKLRTAANFYALTCFVLLAVGCSKTDKDPPDDDDFQAPVTQSENAKACDRSCIQAVLAQRNYLTESDRQNLLSCDQNEAADSSAAYQEAKAAIAAACDQPSIL